MKNPLSYQTTEYDCGPTTMMNAIRYLFRREDIPPDVVKSIMMYTLDAYNTKGESGKNGTSSMAILFLTNWLNQFGQVKNFSIRCEYLKGEAAVINQNSSIADALRQGGAVVVRLMFGIWHYALLTGIGDGYVELFDPYYRIKPFGEKDIEMIPDQPLKANRRVTFQRLNDTGKGYYAMGQIDTREAVILFNTKTRKTPERTIEYFI